MPLDTHFDAAGPPVRQLYDQLLAAMERFGPLSVHPVKSRIVVQSETQFAVLMPRRRWLEGQFWLRRRARHPTVRRVEMGTFRDFGHVFRLADPADVDEELLALLQEAYVVGCLSLRERR